MEKLFFVTLKLACERYDVPFDLGDDEIIELKEKFNECIQEFQILYESEGELQKVMFEFAEQYVLGNEDPKIIPDLSLKAPIQAIDSSMTVLIERHLKDGKFDMAKQELKEAVAREDRRILELAELPDDYDFDRAFSTLFAWCQRAFARIENMEEHAKRLKTLERSTRWTGTGLK